MPKSKIHRVDSVDEPLVHLHIPLFTRMDPSICPKIPFENFEAKYRAQFSSDFDPDGRLVTGLDKIFSHPSLDSNGWVDRELLVC